jgi:tetratricopeptide (TPR) repeat protein
MKAMDDGNLKLAETIIKSIKPDKYDGDYQRIWGRYYYMQGNYVKALEYLDRAVQLRAYNSLYSWQRAMIYIGLSKNDKALDDLKNAYDLDNSSLRVLDGLSYMYFSSKQYDSSIYYAKEMIRVDPAQIGAYYMLANSYYGLKDYNAALQNAQYFIEKTEGTNIYNNQREQLLNMISVISKGSKAP